MICTVVVLVVEQSSPNQPLLCPYKVFAADEEAATKTAQVHQYAKGLSAVEE